MVSPADFNAPFDPTGSAGALAGRPQGPLSGNGGFWDQLWPAAAGAALLAGPSFRQGLANAGAAVVPALQQDRRRNAINAWLKAKSGGGQLDPATLQLLQSDPSLGESVASTMLSPHPKQLSFDRFGRGYVFEPFSGSVQPLTQAGGADGGTDESIPGLGAVRLVPMNRLLGRPQKIGSDASGQAIWRDQTGQLARGPSPTADAAQTGYRAMSAQLKKARDTLYRLGGLKPGDDPAKIQVPDAGSGALGVSGMPGDPATANARAAQADVGRQWSDASGQIIGAARTLDALKPDSHYMDLYVPQQSDNPATRAAKVNQFNGLIDRVDALGGGQSG